MLPLNEALEEFLVRCRVKRLSPKTIHWYGERLGHALAFWQAAGLSCLDEITPRAVRAFLQDGADRGNKPASLNASWRAMHTFFQFWLNEEELARSPVAKVDRAKEPDRDPPVLSVAETLRLLEGCDTRTFRGQRDLMAIRLLTDTGLRREELCSLGLADVDLAERALHVRHGKGDKERYANFGVDTAAALQRYLRQRRQWLGGRASEWLFPSMTETGRHLSGDRLARILAEVAEKAGLHHVHPHLLRHTCFSLMAENGASAWTIQSQAGHADVSTSQRYVHMRRDKARELYDEVAPLDRARSRPAARRT